MGVSKNEKAEKGGANFALFFSFPLLFSLSFLGLCFRFFAPFLRVSPEGRSFRLLFPFFLPVLDRPWRERSLS
jgi:hypothetical protein